MLDKIEQNKELRSLDMGANYKKEEDIKTVKINEEPKSQFQKIVDNNELPEKIINTLPSWSIEPPLEIRR